MIRSGQEGLPAKLGPDFLVSAALAEVKQKYGPGGTEAKFYHNEQHTQDVKNAAQNIMVLLAGTSGKVSQHEAGLVSIAAAYHDIEQGMGAGANEEQSASVAANMMESAGTYSGEDIARVRAMILATRVTHDESGRMHQSANEDDRLSQVLCDADLSILGEPRQIFWDRALDFERERLGKKSLSQVELQKFVMAEIEFLENHQFYTVAAQQLYPYKLANIHWLKTQVV